MLLSLPPVGSLAAQCDLLQESDRGHLEHLLDLQGIGRHYSSFSGEAITIPFVDRVAILCLKLPAIVHEGHLDPERVVQQLVQLQAARWASVLPPVTVLSPDVDSICLCIPRSQLETVWRWELTCEDGHTLTGSFIPAQLPEQDSSASEISERLLCVMPYRLGELPMGYHDLALTTAGGQVYRMPLIASPARCHEPQWMRDGERLWGISAQLYALQSRRNWGIGDFTDLELLIRSAHADGAAFILLNPLHALDQGHPGLCSPYSPHDRRRLNGLYIDPTVEPEFSSPDLQAWFGEPEQMQRLEQSRTGELIDYESVSRLKMGALARMYWQFLAEHLERSRGEQFGLFVEQQGEALLAFANFEARRHADRSHTDADQDPRFHMYVQWLAERQLQRCRDLTHQLGMKVGLVLDLAVGSSGQGAEVMLNRELFCTDVAIGAPPDPLAPQGHNWGLPPLDPRQQQLTAYAHYRELLVRNMHCGGLRVDHVMALMRLWWCPRYDHAGHGAYVHYPAHDLFAILRLESQRNQCIVVGEDLGIVPPEVHEYMRRAAIFSNTLFYFEKYDAQSFRAPAHHSPASLLAVANHDVPTLAAWWNMSDLKLRKELELLQSDEIFEQAIDSRLREKESILRLLQEQWLLPEPWHVEDVQRPFDGALCEAVLRCCARSASQLLSVQLEDMALLEAPVNIPGTNQEYPNWRRRLPPTESLFGLDGQSRTVDLIASITRER